MYNNIRKQLLELKDNKLIAIIDEGRSRRIKEKCRIKGIYNRIFTIETESSIKSFSYSDLICKTIVLKKV